MPTNRAGSLGQSPLVIAVLLLANAVVGRWAYTNLAHHVDYFTLWSVPHALSSSALSDGTTPNIYLPSTQRDMGSVLIEEARSSSISPVQARATQITSALYDSRVDATGTPFVYAMVGLFSSGEYARDVWRFQWFSLACFIVAIGVLCRLLRLPAAVVVICFVFFGFGFTPIRADVRAANINQIQLLALVLFILFSAQGRRILAGIALGLGIALKPNLICVAGSVLLFGLADRDYPRVARTVAGMLLSMVAAVLVGAAYFGRATLWWDFLKSVPRTLGHGYPLASGNYGLAELVSTVTDLPLAEALVVLLFAALVAAVFLSRQGSAFRSDSRHWVLHESFLVVGSGCALMLVGSRLAWLHYYSLLIPVALYLLRPSGEDANGLRREGVVGWWLALCALCLLTDAAQQLSDPTGEAAMVNIATLLLFAGCVHSTWWIRREVVPSTPSSNRGRRAGIRVRSH